MTTDNAFDAIENKPERKVDQGKGIRFVRETLNISQEGLGTMINKNQQQISRMEGKDRIDDKYLEEVALALNVPVDLLKNYSPEETAKNIISGNQFDHTNGVIVENQTNNADPKVVELYHRLLEEKDKLIAEKDLRIAELLKQQ